MLKYFNFAFSSVIQYLQERCQELGQEGRTGEEGQEGRKREEGEEERKGKEGKEQMVLKREN